VQTTLKINKKSIIVNAHNELPSILSEISLSDVSFGDQVIFATKLKDKVQLQNASVKSQTHPVSTAFDDKSSNDAGNEIAI